MNESIFNGIVSQARDLWAQMSVLDRKGVTVLLTPEQEARIIADKQPESMNRAVAFSGGLAFSTIAGMPYEVHSGVNLHRRAEELSGAGRKVILVTENTEEEHENKRTEEKKEEGLREFISSTRRENSILHRGSEADRPRHGRDYPRSR